MTRSSATPAEWQAAAEDVADVLTVANEIARRKYPGGTAPAGMVPALVIALTLAGCVRSARKR